MLDIPKEFEDFSKIHPQKKAKVLYSYLVDGGSMSDVASHLGLEDSREVSHIVRGYGFAGRNSRLFKTILTDDGVSLSDEKGNPIRPQEQAFLAYVKQFPDGYASISGEGQNISNRGKNNLRDFLIEYYSGESNKSDQNNLLNKRSLLTVSKESIIQSAKYDYDLEDDDKIPFRSILPAFSEFTGRGVWRFVIIALCLLNLYVFVAEGYNFFVLLIGLLSIFGVIVVKDKLSILTTKDDFVTYSTRNFTGHSLVEWLTILLFACCSVLMWKDGINSFPVWVHITGFFLLVGIITFIIRLYVYKPLLTKILMIFAIMGCLAYLFNISPLVIIILSMIVNWYRNRKE